MPPMSLHTHTRSSLTERCGFTHSSLSPQRCSTQGSSYTQGIATSCKEERLPCDTQLGTFEIEWWGLRPLLPRLFSLLIFCLIFPIGNTWFFS